MPRILPRSAAGHEENRIRQGNLRVLTNPTPGRVGCSSTRPSNPRHSSEILHKLGHPPAQDRAGISGMVNVMAEFAIRGISGVADEGYA